MIRGLLSAAIQQGSLLNRPTGDYITFKNQSEPITFKGQSENLTFKTI